VEQIVFFYDDARNGKSTIRASRGRAENLGRRTAGALRLTVRACGGIIPTLSGQGSETAKMIKRSHVQHVPEVFFFYIFALFFLRLVDIFFFSVCAKVSALAVVSSGFIVSAIPLSVIVSRHISL